MVGVLATLASGAGAVYGALAVGGGLCAIMGLTGMAAHLRKLYTPPVLASTLMLIAMTLTPTMRDLMFSTQSVGGGGVTFAFALRLIFLMLWAQTYFKGILSSAVLILGMSLGAAAYFALDLNAHPMAMPGMAAMGLPSLWPGELALQPGVIVAFVLCYLAVMSNELEDMQYILLEGEAVDNGISVDDQGGIYCVTSKYMRKFTWDGAKLSDKEEDGAWKSEYDYVPNPRAFSRGSGNTPTLMGFGDDEDKLVVIADAGEKISIVAMWRDEIPDDFEGKPGTKSRRIADQLELTIDVPATIEWSPHVYGNGVMMMASAWPDPVPQADGKVAIFETVLTAGVTREAPTGAEKWSWDSKTHSFKSDWTVDYPLQWALHPVSASSDAVLLTPVEVRE